jgi:four helix bundle protein
MKHVYSFEKLDVWKHAKDLAIDVYRLTDQLPTEEKYGMISQIRRSAFSIPANISEGSSRLSGKSQGNFYQIAYSSLLELYNHLVIVTELNLIEEPKEIYEKVYTVTRMLNGLHKSTQKEQKD